MLTRRRFLALVGAGSGLTAAVAVGVALLPAEAGKSGPPHIRFGRENCAHCGMLIGDPNYAAGWRDGRGAETHFDDIGCMVAMAREHGSPPGARFFAHSYDGNAWLDAPTAAYVVSPQIRSPMGYGVAAPATSAAAEELASGLGGRVDTWDGLFQNLQGRG
jgi:copper chaperone NosL